MFPVFDCVFYFPVSLSLFQRVPVPCNVVTLYFFSNSFSCCFDFELSTRTLTRECVSMEGESRSAIASCRIMFCTQSAAAKAWKDSKSFTQITRRHRRPTDLDFISISYGAIQFKARKKKTMKKKTNKIDRKRARVEER